MSLRRILGILILWGLLGSLPLGEQVDGPLPSWRMERAEALESISRVIPSDRLPTDRHLRPERVAPQKAHDLLVQLQSRQGKPLPGYIGGREFRNRERRLPRGHYREYDVNPKIRGRPRDAERIVIEQDTGRAYYTSDHYRTFVPLNERP
jgi:ribonuclease T1